MLNLLHLYWLDYILLTSATIPLMDTVVLMGDTATVDVSISVAVFFGNELLNLIWDLNWTWCEHISVFVYNNVTEKKNLIDIKQHLYVLILHVLNTTLQFSLKTYFAFGMKLQICTPGPDGCPRENNSRTSMSYTYAVRTSVSSASKTVALNLPSLYWLTWLLSTVLQCKIDWQALSTSNCFTSFRLIFIWKWKLSYNVQEWFFFYWHVLCLYT